MKKVSIFLVMLVSILTFSFNNDVQAQSGRRIIVDATTSINSGLSFSTIKKAVDSALSGDTVIVKEGTYREKIRVNNKLVLASEFLLDGNRAHIANTIITGDSLAQNSLSDALIYSTVGGDTSTFKLIGLTVTKAAKYGVYAGFATIRDCILQNSGSANYTTYSLTGANINNTTFKNNIGLNIIYFTWIWYNQTPATITNCLFVNNKGAGVDGYNPGRNNSGVVYFENSQAIVTNNVFYNNSGDNLFSVSGYYKDGRYSDTLLFANNTFYKNNTRTAFFRNWEGDNRGDNYVALWYNNIIDNNYTLATNTNIVGEFGWGQSWSRDRPSTTLFKNNLMASDLNTDANSGYQSDGGYTFTYSTSNNFKGSASINDTANLDFSLRSNSLGIGMGIRADTVARQVPSVWYTIPAFDKTGITARPSPIGSYPEIGAIESTKKIADPKIVSIANAVYNSKPVVKINYSLAPLPAVDSIIIYRDSVSDKTTPTPFDTVFNDLTAKSIYIDSVNITKGQKYFYNLRVFKSGVGGIVSDTSASDTVRIPATLSSVKVPALSALSATRNYINVAYTITPAGTGKTFIDIYKGSTAANATLLATVRDTVLSYKDSSIAQSTDYAYYLVNRDTSGISSEASATRTFTTLGAVPFKFYVNPNTSTVNGHPAGSDAAVGDSTHPFKTTTVAFANAIKGDTIILVDGSYNSNIKFNAGITVGSKYLIDKDTTHIRATIINAAGLRGTVVNFVSNLTCCESARTYFIGLTFTGQTGTAKMFNYSWGNWNKYLTIDHSVFKSNGNRTLAADQYDDYTRLMIFGDSVVLSNNTFEGNYGKIRVEGTNFTVTKNIFINNNNNIVRTNNGAEVPMIETWTNGNGKVKITDNIFSNNGTQKGVNDGTYYRDNIFRIQGNDSLFLANNTFYKNLVPAIAYYDQSPIQYVVNNIFYKNEKDLWVNTWNSNFGDVFLSNNFFTKDLLPTGELDKLNVTAANNLIESDPQFADTVLLTLAPSSTIINMGVNTYGKGNAKLVSTTDLYGTARPLPASTKSDIGAVESKFGFSAPTLKSLDGGDSTVVLKWTKPTNGAIAGYDIFRSTSLISDTSTLAAVKTISNADTLSVTDSALNNLTKYYYRIKAFTASKALLSGFSNQLSVTPNTPPGPIDTVIAYGGTRNVVLKWSDYSEERRKYNIYRGTSATSLDKLASAVDTTYYVDNSAAVNVKYYYGIKVIDSVGAASKMSKITNATASSVWNIDTAGKSTGNGSIKFPYKNIQFAIDNSQAGDTILLNNGTYIENIEVFNKSVVLKAKNIGKAIISPLDATTKSTLSVQDQNPWVNSDVEYPKDKNKFIGLVFIGSSYTNGGSNAAVAITNSSNPIFESCSFSNNSSQNVVYIESSAPLFNNCLFLNNTNQNAVINVGWADTTQPKTRWGRIVNSVINNNTYFNRWGGMEKGLLIINSIITENGYENNFSAKTYKVVNSIVDNSKFVAQSATNSMVDPQFNNTAASDYSLSNFSPALGKSVDSFVLKTGVDTLYALKYDFNYAVRPVPTGSKADLGAFENKYSIAGPQITRLQKSGTTVTITWEKTGSTALTSLKVYRDTSKKYFDTLAPLSITPSVSAATFEDVLPSSNKVYYYAIKAMVGTVPTGLSNIKSTLDTTFVPAINFSVVDTASLKIRAAARSWNSLGQSVNLVKLAADAPSALPKIIIYSQENRQVDSSKGGFPQDSVLVLNINKLTGTPSVNFTLNKSVSIAKGKNDYMQLVSAMNVNGDNEFDLVGIYKKNTDMGGNSSTSKIVYLTNTDLNFKLDTVLPPANFFNTSVNNWGQSTNLAYKWDQKTFERNQWSTQFGQNIEATAEFMDGNFDGKDELVATLNQVKWEPNSTLNFGNNNSITNVNSNVLPIKFIDINKDGIPDIFAMTTCPSCVGLGQVNGNPLVVFVSNKKDGKFYMYITGLNIDWSSNIYFGDFQNNRKVQVLTRINGGNYRVYDFDNTFNAVSANMQFNGILTDGKIDIGDINGDGYPDIVGLDNSGNINAYLNDHLSGFTKKSIGSIPFANSNIWSIFNVKIADLNRDGFKDVMWLEEVQNDGMGGMASNNNFYLKSWIQTPVTGALVRTSPPAVAAANITVVNDGYKVKIKWTPTSDVVDNYLFANLKVDTSSKQVAPSTIFKKGRINTGYNYRFDNDTVPIVLEKTFARNYPDSVEFTDVNISSKTYYHVALQMVNKEGKASAFTKSFYIPTDPLTSIKNQIPGMQNAKFSWGDYDNDGLLDLAVIGFNDVDGIVTKVYHNEKGEFIDQNLTTNTFYDGDIKWVDLNNDGWLDLAILGNSEIGPSFQMLMNNQQGSFEISNPKEVTGLMMANMAFGDYDNNGTLDMITMGRLGEAKYNTARTFLYSNNGKGKFTKDLEFSQSNAVPNLSDADARFVDYDLDGDLDLVYAGTDSTKSAQGGVRINTILDPKVTSNNYGSQGYNNGYTYNLSTYDMSCSCNVGLAMNKVRFDIGDIDGDGDMDIVEMGTSLTSSNNNNMGPVPGGGGSTTATPQPRLMIFRNQTIENKSAKFGNYFSYGNIYSTAFTILDSIDNGDVKLVDFNNDGLLDITAAGLDNKASSVTKFYLNEGGFGNFTAIKNTQIPAYKEAGISWGDADGDGSMDLVISGYEDKGRSTSIFMNNQGGNSNKAPSIPQNLAYIDQGQGRILLKWDAAEDDHTNKPNMYYNLKLGTAPGLSDLRIIQVNPTTDQLQTPNTSLIGNNQYYLELPPGVYYWSVQAVDGNYSSSKFAPNQKLTLTFPWQFVNQGGLVDKRIQPLATPSFAWADVNNTGNFDFLYLGVTSGMNSWNSPVGLYRNMGGKFAKLSNNTYDSTYAGRGTGFSNALDNLVSPEIKWVDLNNDGLVDLVVAGDNSAGQQVLKVFKNEGKYKFTEMSSLITGLTGVVALANPKIEFVDLDNNGYKDLIYGGNDPSSTNTKGVFKFIGFYKDTTKTNTGTGSGAGTSTIDPKTGLPIYIPPTTYIPPAGSMTGSGTSSFGITAKVITSNLDSLLTAAGAKDVNFRFGDMNKDKKIDLAILYSNTSKIRKGEVYLNSSDTTNKISFTKSTINLPTLTKSTLDLIDYNNDGLLDVAVSGTNSTLGQVFIIYQNKWRDSAAGTIQLVQSASAVKSFESGQTTWGDLDADGYPDIIFSGTRTGVGPITAMAFADPSTLKKDGTGILKYRELPTFPFGNYTVMRPSLGDFGGNKVLDLVLVGTENITDPTSGVSTKASSFKILKNVRNLASRVPITPASIGASEGTISSMSLDNAVQGTGIKSFVNAVKSFDAITDSTIAVADTNYIEKSYVSNQAPSSPNIDTTKIISQVGNKYLVELSWKAAKDDNTPSEGLTYAVMVGTSPTTGDIVDPNASLATGGRKTPEMGNAGQNNAMNVLLEPGTYYWSVQAIDATNSGSTFSTPKTIQITSSRSIANREAPYDLLLNKSTATEFSLNSSDFSSVFKLSALDKDSTVTFRYSIITDANYIPDPIFTIDTVSNSLKLKGLPTQSSYTLKLRVTDSYGLIYEKIVTFKTLAGPSRVLLNSKDTSIVYFSKSTADSAALKITLRAAYTVAPTTTPVLTYKVIAGTGGDNNNLFTLKDSVLVNKRKLDDADTLKVRVSVTDQNNLTVEKIIKFVNIDCVTKPTLLVNALTTACLPNGANLTDTALLKGTNTTGLTFTYFTDVDAFTKVTDPTKVATAGVYYIKAINAAGCGVIKPIEVKTLAATAVPKITASAACLNQTAPITVAYTATAGTRLVWYGTAATGGTATSTAPVFSAAAVGTTSFYAAQVDTAKGCVSDRVKVDVVVSAIPTAGTITRDADGYLVSSGKAGFKWYDAQNVLVDSVNAKFKPTTPGSYTMKYSENGCTSTASVAYYYLITDVINLSATEYIKLAPNPFVNYLNIDFVVKGYQKLNIDVFATSTGARVASKQGLFAGTRVSFAELSAGIYIFRVSSPDGKLSYQFKMVKL